MPGKWVHAVYSLIAFGRPYLDRHDYIDAPSQGILGRRHRRRRHDYYHLFGKRWDIEDPFPEWVRELTSRHNRLWGDKRTEQQLQVSLEHSYVDREWDGLSAEEKAEREQVLKAIALDPDMLREWAGVDVVEGKIQRTLYDGSQIWESEPSLPGEYKRLAKYIRTAFGETSGKI